MTYCVAHRAGLDFGGVVIGIPLYIALSAFMLAVMLLAWKGKAQRGAAGLAAGRVAGGCDPAAGGAVAPDGAASATAAAVAGIGVAWLYLQWRCLREARRSRGHRVHLLRHGRGLRAQGAHRSAAARSGGRRPWRCRSSRPRWRAARNAGSRRHSASRGCSTTRTPRPSRGRSCSAWRRTA
ncbi:MAG: hypothetical protein ACLTMP_07870 [Eggerthella lenta]